MVDPCIQNVLNVPGAEGFQLQPSRVRRCRNDVPNTLGFIHPDPCQCKSTKNCKPNQGNHRLNQTPPCYAKTCEPQRVAPPISINLVRWFPSTLSIASGHKAVYFLGGLLPAAWFKGLYSCTCQRLKPCLTKYPQKNPRFVE